MRDVTATVESIPLIASSIMSKKIAAGAKCILLDVKMGSGAFMNTTEQATELATQMVNIGNLAQRKTMAVITNMDVPLGKEIGNNLEVKEAIDVLKGIGPKDLKDICVELAANMLMLCTEKNKEECINLVKTAISDGSAFNKFRELVIEQGGNVELIDNPELFNNSNYNIEVTSNQTGYINKMDSAEIGRISGMLGAGRITKEDVIDYSAGITLKAKTGDFVNQGDVLAVLHTSKQEIIEEAKQLYLAALDISEQKPEEQTLIYKTIK